MSIRFLACMSRFRRKRGVPPKEKETGLYWHCHHHVLYEYVYHAEERREHIRTKKPKRERALRLRLFQPVRTPPAVLTDALITYVRAGDECHKAFVVHNPYDKTGLDAFNQTAIAYQQAGNTLYKIATSVRPEMLALHAIECPNCPWDGTTIFPGKETP